MTNHFSKAVFKNCLGHFKWRICKIGECMLLSISLPLFFADDLPLLNLKGGTICVKQLGNPLTRDIWCFHKEIIPSCPKVYKFCDCLRVFIQPSWFNRYHGITGNNFTCSMKLVPSLMSFLSSVITRLRVMEREVINSVILRKTLTKGEILRNIRKFSFQRTIINVGESLVKAQILLYIRRVIL